MLDGHDLKDLKLSWLREQMGLVSQEPALFGTTIAANILFGKEGADMDQIVKAAVAANAHSFVQGLPDGYHTQVDVLQNHLFASATSDSIIFWISSTNCKQHKITVSNKRQL